jgi:oligopeptide/dipeptide ABC transporter ATP-binding protein
MTDHRTADVSLQRDVPKGAHLLEVKDLFVEFRTRDGVAKVINGVSYYLDQGEALAVLGESGSGKSVTAQAIMGILDIPPGHIASGEILFEGRDLLKMSEGERRATRGRDIAMIFQDALSALNPVYKVGYQFSGGMRQRVMIAMALAMNPKVLIADEPTTALDVTVQAQIMDLLADLRRDLNMGVILITHDLGVVADVADRIAVMYAGRIVEHADVHAIYKAPAHPYTKGLLESIPRLDTKGTELATIKGLPPNLMRIPDGCSFNPRCQYAQEICRTTVPPNKDLGGGRTSRCHFAEEVLNGDV